MSAVARTAIQELGPFTLPRYESNADIENTRRLLDQGSFFCNVTALANADRARLFELVEQHDEKLFQRLVRGY